MGRHSDQAREVLMDSAEELFAQHGIDAVSNRRIAEHAGSANHSAVAYHFGTRDDLLRALLLRHMESMDARRHELLAALGPNPSVRDLVACRLLPFVEVLDALPRPSWRAQFIAQLPSTPSVLAVIREITASQGLADDLESIVAQVDGIPETVVRGRSSLLGHLVVRVCAEFEQRLNAGTESGDWIDVGYFLVDTGAGMLAAPVTHRAERAVAVDAGTSLV